MCTSWKYLKDVALRKIRDVGWGYINSKLYGAGVGSLWSLASYTLYNYHLQANIDWWMVSVVTQADVL